MPPGTDISVTSATAAQVEALLVGNKEVKNYYTTVGTSTSLMGAMSTASGGGDNTATITVYLNPGADMDKEAEALGNATKEIATKANAGIAISASESGSGPGAGFSDLNISIQGQNQNDIANTTGQLFAQLQGVKGLANLESDLTMVVPKLDIELDQAKVAALGLPPAQLQQLQQEFYLLMMGSTLPNNVADIGNESYPIFIKGVASGLGNVTEADSMRIGWPQAITLDKVADVTLTDVPTHISHTDLALSATITGAITEKDVGGVNQCSSRKNRCAAISPRRGGKDGWCSGGDGKHLLSHGHRYNRCHRDRFPHCGIYDALDNQPADHNGKPASGIHRRPAGPAYHWPYYRCVSDDGHVDASRHCTYQCYRAHGSGGATA